MNLVDAMTIDGEQVTNTIVDFIRQKVADYHRDGVCIGISGGLDSAVAVTLARRAMDDPSKIYGLNLFDRDSQPRFRQYARQLAEKLGINFETQDISSPAQALGAYRRPIMRFVTFSRMNRFVLTLYQRVCSFVVGENFYFMNVGERRSDKRLRRKIVGVFPWILGSIFGSFEVRHTLRKEILEDYATQRNLLLIGAANRTEAFIGWFVPNGVDDLPIEPIMGLYKSQVFQLARFLDIPREILEESPTPDMVKGLADEDIIGYPYEKLDKVAYMIEHGLSKDIALDNGITPKEFKSIEMLNRLTYRKRESQHEFPPFD